MHFNKRYNTFTRENLRDTLGIGAICIGVFILLRWLVPISHVPSVSMEPTIAEDSKVLVNNTRFWRDTPQRGDVVVFDSGYRAGVWEREKVRLTKRVVGLPGERIEITPGGQVYIDGQRLQEAYVLPALQAYPQTTIPEGHYFVLGDNRSASHDSRVLGAIAADRIEGKVIAVVWPLGAFSVEL
ncbi:MAG: signal peptidase I [Cyanobacteria bacterium P01_F01_bin.53]